MAANFPDFQKSSDPISWIKDRFHNSKRYANWIWNFSYIHDNKPFYHQTPEDTANLFRVIESNLSLQNEIAEKQYLLINDSDLSFINDSRRQLSLLEKHFQLLTNFHKYSRANLLPDLNLTYREKIITQIDLLPINRQHKIEFLSNFKSTWEEIISQVDFYSWLNDHSPPKIKKHFSEWILKQNQFKNYKIDSNDLEDSEFLQIVCERHLDNPLERKVFIEKFRRAWNTKSYRENLSGKKQCNIALSNDAIKILEHLSKKNRYPKSKILEILLLGEKREGHYISKKLKEMDLLSTPLTSEELLSLSKI